MERSLEIGRATPLAAPRLASLALSWEAVALLVLVLLSGARFYRLRHWVDFTDENDNAAVGWLLTRGERLYGTVFSHHMPGAYLAASAVFRLAPTDHVSRSRAIPWLLYALVAVALFRSPLLDRRRGLLAASVFLASASLVLPLSFGHMLLADSLWGALVAVLAVTFLLPLLAGLVPGRRATALAGACAAAAAGTALMAVHPLVVSTLGCLCLAVASRPHRQALARVAPTFLIASSATSLLLLAWVARVADLPGLVEQAVFFNRDVYAPMFPEKVTTGRLLVSTLREFVSWIVHAPGRLRGGEGGACVALLAPLALLSGLAATRPPTPERSPAARALPARALPALVLRALTLAGLLVLTRTRGPMTRELPCQILVLALLSLGLASTLRRGRRAIAGAGLLAVAAPIGVVVTGDPSLGANPSATVSNPPEAVAAATYVRERTSPEERVLSLGSTPGFYLFAQRRPAVDSVFYFPWQAWWEARFPRVPDTAEQLRRHPPRFVFYRPERIWGVFPFEDYARPLDRFVKERYEPVEPERFGGLLWRRIDARRIP